jgi:hypothetical protein
MADQDNHQHADGIDRRGFLKCMAWAGAGLVWTFSGGVLAGCATVSSSSAPVGDFSFAQHADCRIRAYTSLDGVPAIGLGDRRQRPGAWVSAAVWVADGLNGHIHQILQKVEGNLTFHTARSTAFPHPAPGSAPSPGPIKDVPAEKLRSALGVTSVSYVERNSTLAIVDATLG